MGEGAVSEVSRNLSVLNEGRAAVYALLARCYEREIDEDFAAALSAEGAFESDDEQLNQAFCALQGEVHSLDASGLEELAVVFDRVFFGMGPRAAQKAFPYESVYTSEKGLMMQDAFAAVKHVYANAAFAKNPDFKEPEDHMAVELSFMGRQAAQAVEALQAGDEACAEQVLRSQQSFLDNHLLNWVDRFAADLRVAADGGFYAHLAAFTVAFLSHDRDVLAEVLA